MSAQRWVWLARDEEGNVIRACGSLVKACAQFDDPSRFSCLDPLTWVDSESGYRVERYAVL